MNNSEHTPTFYHKANSRRRYCVDIFEVAFYLLPIRSRKSMAEGGCGGNSAILLQKIEASPAALLVKAKHHRKKIFSLGETEIRRAQNEKSKEYFSVVWRVVASGGGAASLVSFKESSRKVYNYSTKTNLFGNDCSARRVRRAPQGKIRFCFRRKIPEFAPITI